MVDAVHAPIADRVGIVVTTHEGPGERLHRCLASIRASDPGVAVIVVDNGASDERIDERVYGNIEHVRVENRGFGAAANVGFGHPAVEACDLLALLNDDVVVSDGWLGPLVDCLDADRSIAAVQPKLVLADTEPPMINSLGVELDRYGAGRDVAYDTLESAIVDESIRTVDIVTGGAMLLRRSFLADVDGFDERLFLYYEDVDLCLRGAERGWTFRCVPASRVEHDKGASTGEIGDDRRRLQERNRLIVAARFATPQTIARALWLSVRRLRHEPRAAHRQALLQGVAGMPRALVERVQARRRLR